MTISEFRAWLDGYNASIDVCPTSEQWKIIQAKIAELRNPMIQGIPYQNYQSASNRLPQKALQGEAWR